MKQYLTAVFTALVLVSTTHADVVDPRKANGDFIPGTGIPGDNFVGSTATSGESVYFKGRGRDTGQAVSQNGNRFYVEPGFAVSNPSAPWWNFDFQFSPGAAGQGLEDYILSLWIDIDPATSGTDFVVLSAVIGDADSDPSNSWDDGDSLFFNPGGGSWSDDVTPWVVSNSWRMNFSFIDPAFDVFAPGVYEFRIFADDATGTIVSQTAFVQVIPEPSMFVIMGAVPVALLLTSRRRR